MADETQSNGPWREACDADALTSAMKPVHVAGAELILVRSDDAIIACDRACPHEFADLSYGHVADGRIHCPHHRASFDLSDGTVSNGWSCPDLRLYPTRIVDGKVWIDMSQTEKRTP